MEPLNEVFAAAAGPAEDAVGRTELQEAVPAQGAGGLLRLGEGGLLVMMSMHFTCTVDSLELRPFEPQPCRCLNWN